MLIELKYGSLTSLYVLLFRECRVKMKVNCKISSIKWNMFKAETDIFKVKTS